MGSAAAAATCGGGPQVSDLPVEMQRLILSYLADDSFTLHRVERVCLLWQEIVLDLEAKGIKFRRRKIVRRLLSVESLNESIGIRDLISTTTTTTRGNGSLIAERAEKVFRTHMEIIRLKYPISLQRLNDAGLNRGRRPSFRIDLTASRSIILTAIGVFLPHGENVAFDRDLNVLARVSVSSIDPLDRNEWLHLGEARISLSANRQLEMSKMCPSTGAGFPLETCYDPPAALNSQRKPKRRCFGVHPLEVTLDNGGVEIEPGKLYSIDLSMFYEGTSRFVETVWGGSGSERVKHENVAFTFYKHRSNENGNVLSSVHSGQIPFLCYI